MEVFRAAHVLAFAAFIDYLQGVASRDQFVALNAARPNWQISSVDDLRASAKTIIASVRQWADGGRLNAAHFGEHLAYFKDRYFAEGAFTRPFENLHLRANDGPNIVKAVLSGENEDEADAIIALLIIVYRQSNNFFHGQKWAYKLQGQFGNFSHANAVLMQALELNECP